MSLAIRLASGTSGEDPSLGLILHHDDAEREVAYDRASSIGKFDLVWDKATREGWIVVSMKDDWATIFPFQAWTSSATSCGLASPAHLPDGSDRD